MSTTALGQACFMGYITIDDTKENSAGDSGSHCCVLPRVVSYVRDIPLTHREKVGGP